MSETSSQNKWNASHPKAMWAHSALRSAIRKGLISRGDCEVCGHVHGDDGISVDGHHFDYDRPMAVRWLCRAHHKAEHRRLKGEAV